MGQGIQQPPVEQGGAGGAALDLFKVMLEPTAVFERVRERPKFLVPFLALCAINFVIFFVNLSILRVALQAEAAAAGTPDVSKYAPWFSLGVPIVIGLIVLISALVLWVLVSMIGGDGKFTTLLSMTTYALTPTFIVYAIIGAIILTVQGTGQITSTQDMQPPVGLDLLAPNVKGFVGAVLKGINPFSIWSLVLTAIGVSTTHRLSKSNGYVVATISFVLGLLIGAVFAMFGNRGG